jgi:hypothetical protein
VALLRGVNVGGKNLLPMKHLASLFEAAVRDGIGGLCSSFSSWRYRDAALITPIH